MEDFHGYKPEIIVAYMTSDSTFYHVTEKGIEAYSRWAKGFLNFTRSAYGLEDNIGLNNL